MDDETCWECELYYECDGPPCVDNHDCEDNAELTEGSDSLMFWECQVCGEQVSGFVGQFGMLWDDEKESLWSRIKNAFRKIVHQNEV